MTREQALEIIKRESDLYSEDSVDSVEWLEVYKALEQQPSEDCVSREQAIKTIGTDIQLNLEGRSGLLKYSDEIKDILKALLDSQEKKLQALPPVTPTFPKGATNGDIIKAMFNCMVIDISKGKVYVEHIYFPFDEEWWNAPYKRGNENGI